MVPQWLTIAIGILILFLAGIGVCYLWVKWRAAPYLYDDVKNLLFHETALVLGTAKFTSKGGENLYFRYRMETAQKIFLNHKASRFIVSGANKSLEPNKEAFDMKIALIALGIPGEIILADNAGYRTWDSLWRCRESFDTYNAIVVSQRFHNERALFIGRRFGMKLVGLNSLDVGGHVSIRMFLRECLARVKCILDCFVLRPLPIYLKKNKFT